MTTTPIARRFALIASCSLLVTLFLGAPRSVRATANDIYIAYAADTSTADCTDPGFTATGTDDSAQIALAVAATNEEGTLHFCPGTYDIDTTIDLGGKLITLQGADAATTILDGGAAYVAGAYVSGGVVILTSSGAITVSDLTFRHAHGLSDSGGAIHTHATVTATNSIFTDNSTGYYGGAIFSFTAIITNCTFTGNTAGNNAGGALRGDYVTVTGSTFSDNHAYEGGGISAHETATVTGSTFTNNSAENNGGAIATTNGGAKVTTSTFTHNVAGSSGGALYLTRATKGNLQQMRNNTFTRNRAHAGGAMSLADRAYSRSLIARVERNNTFSRNRATRHSTQNIDV